ncbi:amino acid ABC transporter permease [Acidaminococcus sp. NSJ-142]|jgi:L-cystine transport system permease protein|uniref:amino acid ABC transporter permease n=1 Tax=Acidaminococcus TaxID=904 RepID=UPI000CF9D8C6|nr:MULTISPECIES: amino acid ABC transporter permease [Acidaminococcus]MCD2436112.1 amino acid ABC transporter permease [Acidaminococcus hominis]MCH4096089.1 amino acid ABC transporter permease [Acidaminococcus provencensis]RHK00923.1 amino acid ABC transporter permease [Acidaminococcus sp. AM05-11]
MELDTAFMADTFLKIWSGIGTTLGLTALSLLIAIPFAFYMALLRIRGNVLGSSLTKAYVSFVRGTPIVLQILLFYSLLPSFLNVVVKSLGLDFNVFESIDPFWYAVIIFALNTTALLSEVFRSALLSIPRGQLEAGVSIGLSPFQTYRKIIIPQAAVVALPAVCNITVNLIKGTSLAFLMTVKDVLAVGKIAASYGYNYIEAYLDVFVVYLIVCTVVQLAYKLAENRMGSFRAA